MTIPKIKIQLPCTYYWDEIGHAQDPAKTQTKYTYEYEKSHTITLSSLVEQSNSEIRKKAENSSSGIEAVDIGGGDTQSIWQKIFKGPGINVTTDVIFAQPSKPSGDEVSPIELELHGIRFLSDIDVSYTDNDSPPHDSIVVVNNASGDINKGFKGKYVWIIPKWSSKLDDACSYVNVDLLDDADGRKDLAKDAGGKWRYLNPIQNANNTKKITDIQLLRQSEASSPQHIKENLGFDGRSEDLNEGRKGDFLYLVWKTLDLNFTPFES